MSDKEEIDDIEEIDGIDELDAAAESEAVEEVVVVEPAERDYSQRKLLAIEPDDQKIAKLETVLGEILPGAAVTLVDDCDEAMEISDDNNFDTVVIDLQYEEFSSHEFVKMVNNDAEILLVSFKVDNVDMVDFQNRFKLEPLRKIFDNAKNAKIKI
ncbi:MAG: hypothetical protein OCC49_16295 [Fibrobacterales bacterium]